MHPIRDYLRQVEGAGSYSVRSCQRESNPEKRKPEETLEISKRQTLERRIPFSLQQSMDDNCSEEENSSSLERTLQQSELSKKKIDCPGK